MTNTPKLTLFCLALDDANPAERAPLLTDLPAPARDIWHVISRPRYTSRARHPTRPQTTHQAPPSPRRLARRRTMPLKKINT
ncbi:hypothetical protein ACFVY0_47820, partial [Streptomyces sp. NPDC058286]